MSSLSALLSRLQQLAAERRALPVEEERESLLSRVANAVGVRLGEEEGWNFEAGEEGERAYAEGMREEAYGCVDLLGEELATRHNFASQAAASTGETNLCLTPDQPLSQSPLHSYHHWYLYKALSTTPSQCALVPPSH